MNTNKLARAVTACIASTLVATGCSGHGTPSSSGVLPAAQSGRHHVPQSIHINPGATNARRAMTGGGPNIVADPGFESGGLTAGWYACGNAKATIDTSVVHSGTYAAHLGSPNAQSGSIYGDSGICQTVTIPQTGQLSFWVYQASNEPDATYAWAEADLLDAHGNVVTNIYKNVTNNPKWALISTDVSQYVGRTVTLYFGVHGDGYPGNYTTQYIDDVSLQAAPPPTKPVTVGTLGNEPIVVEAPDGTLYVSALQHFYRSTNSGATWTNLAGPPETGQINQNSDSSISVDPGGRVYFTFDWPYAGATAVCTSDDRGNTWSCNPSVVPGGTDRMWISSPDTSNAYETTNEGLYQTAFLQSSDRGQTWTPYQLGNSITQPQTGPLLQVNSGNYILQPVNENGFVFLYRYLPVETTQLTNELKPTGIPAPVDLPSMALSTDGTLWGVGEGHNAVGGKDAVLSYSTDMGDSFHPIAPIPQTATGTAAFTSVAAGSPGHVGVLYYYTPDSGDPSNLPNSTWSAMYAETYNATSATPSWTVTTLETGVHAGDVCAALSCAGNARFSGDFVTAEIDANNDVNLVYQNEKLGVRFVRIPHH